MQADLINNEQKQPKDTSIDDEEDIISIISTNSTEY